MLKAWIKCDLSGFRNPLPYGKIKVLQIGVMRFLSKVLGFGGSGIPIILYVKLSENYSFFT